RGVADLEAAGAALTQDSEWKTALHVDLTEFFADFSRWMKPFCLASLAKIPSLDEFTKSPDYFLTTADLLEFAADYIADDAKFIGMAEGILKLLDAPKAVEIRVFHGRYEGSSFKETSREVIFARYRARVEALVKRAKEGAIAPKLVETTTFNDRATERYEHGSLPRWGAKNPEQKDYFYIVYPKDGAQLGRPLYVVLHSAGHSARTALDCTPTIGNHDIYRAPDDFYAIYVDCFDNRETDWWWGGRRADETEINAENAERSSAELQPVEKRVLDEIAWAIKTFDCDVNRVYLCGNSMGGSGTLGLGLRNGYVFAAIKANVPAGVHHACDRLQIDAERAPENLPEPPVCFDYSAPNDDWSRGHERLFAGVENRKYAYVAYWGNFGHENNDAKVAAQNDLFKTFDWTSIKKNEAYPVFTSATTDDAAPWPERPAEAPAGQRGAYFRWTVVKDSAENFEIELRLAGADEIKSRIFETPVESTADVSLRRLQEFDVAPGEKINWAFGEQSGVVDVDAD
ncbi:MAG: hypothetical protein HUK22_06095, partial [Thermoguttaceae bacterium]|nr:hypothetical protein [Thermoguttaceae bacterium]